MAVTIDFELLPPPESERSSERPHVCSLCERQFQQSRALLRQWDRTLRDYTTRLVWVPQHCPRCERQRLAR